MKRTQVYKWHKRLRNGRSSVDDDQRCGLSSTSTKEENIQRVRNVVLSDRQKRIQEVPGEVGTSLGSVHRIIHKDLYMHYISQHLFPNMLTPEHKETRMTLTGDLITMADQDVDLLIIHSLGMKIGGSLWYPQPKRQSCE
jgi:hypothetical protein